MVTLLRIAWMRIRTNMRDPLHWKNVAYFMIGKLVGLTLLLTAMWVFLHRRQVKLIRAPSEDGASPVPTRREPGQRCLRVAEGRTLAVALGMARSLHLTPMGCSSLL
jgi:hypothetical protein